MLYKVGNPKKWIMGAVSMESLPLGFRFRPTDEELVNHYLRLKINGRHSDVRVIPDIDVCKWEPWDLPGSYLFKSHNLIPLFSDSDFPFKDSTAFKKTNFD